MAVSADVLLRKIRKLEKANELSSAEQLYMKILSIYPENRTAQKGYERLKAAKNCPTQVAIREVVSAFDSGKFKVVLEKLSHFGDPLLLPSPLPTLIGISHSKVGALEESIAILKPISDADPSNVQYLNNLAIVLNINGSSQAALECYKKIIQKDPQFGEAYFNLGNLYLSMKEYGLAISCYEKGDILLPVSRGLLLNMLNALVESGDQKKAIDVARRFFDIFPDGPEAYVQIAHMYEMVENYTEALEFYGKAVQLSTEGLKRNPLSSLYRYYEDKSLGKKLECLLFLKCYDDFNHLLMESNKSNPNSIRVATLSVFSAHYFKQETVSVFCRNPLKFVHTGSLSYYRSDHEKYVSELLIDVSKLHSEWEPRYKTTMSGYQTGEVIFDNTSASLVAFENILRQEIQSYYEKFQGEKCGFIENWPQVYTLKGWFVRLVKSGYQDPHIHPGGWLSGVLYLKTADAMATNEGAIEFGVQGYSYPVIKGESATLTINPEPGDIVLFPSSLFHRTIPFDSDQDRCVIAFDLIPG